MKCFSCFGSSSGGANGSKNGVKQLSNDSDEGGSNVNRGKSDQSRSQAGRGTANLGGPHIFTFSEILSVAYSFRPEACIGTGGFGRVYRGRLPETGQQVAVKRLDLNGVQGNREFLVELFMLSLLHHPNVVKLVGYCAAGHERILVYEYLPLGSLEYYLHGAPNDKILDWNTRMKIAVGAAKGLEYLHEKAYPPVIYRDLKSSNILLDQGFFPKLSDFGLAKLGPVGDDSYVNTRVMGTYGYCAPDYAVTGQLTPKSDVYSFGVVFLEIITGREAIDRSRIKGERNLVGWLLWNYTCGLTFAQSCKYISDLQILMRASKRHCFYA